MWSKRKPKNRRFERGHILDVKVESRKLRALRLRAVARVFSGLLITATVVLLTWRGGNWFLDEFVFGNPAFNIQRIEVETDGILSASHLRNCAGAKLGENLLALDLAQVQRNLDYFPWVESAAVERVRPDTLRIRVTEREPIAQTTLFEPGADGVSRKVTFYFDANGVVMLPLEPRAFETPLTTFDNLPLLTGIAGRDLHPGHRVDSPQIQAALRLIVEFGHSEMLGLADITSLDLSVPGLVQISTGQGASITFSVDRLEVQLRRWRLVHDYAVEKGKAIASLDLSVTNNVPARWFEAAALPTTRPKALKPSPYKKKHV